VNKIIYHIIDEIVMQVFLAEVIVAHMVTTSNSRKKRRVLQLLLNIQINSGLSTYTTGDVLVAQIL
jgi:hypothetical protein